MKKKIHISFDKCVKMENKLCSDPIQYRHDKYSSKHSRRSLQEFDAVKPSLKRDPLLHDCINILART